MAARIDVGGAQMHRDEPPRNTAEFRPSDGFGSQSDIQCAIPKTRCADRREELGATPVVKKDGTDGGGTLAEWAQMLNMTPKQLREAIAGVGDQRSM